MANQDLEASGLGIFFCICLKNAFRCPVLTQQQCFVFATRNLSKSGFSEKGRQVDDSFYEAYV